MTSATFQALDAEIFYTRTGPAEAPPILILHGWGSSSAAFAPLMAHLSLHYQVYALDFPGFGQSPEPPFPWSVREYAHMTQLFCQAMGLFSPLIIAHSFGARVAILLATTMRIPHMVLTGAAGIRPARTWRWYLKVYSFKAMRLFTSLPGLRHILRDFIAAYKKQAGSADYRQASPLMKQVLTKVVSEDLAPLLPTVHAATFLIWGAKDTATPLADGQRMAAEIPRAQLVVLEKAGHYAFLDQPQAFEAILDAYLKEACPQCIY